MGSKEGNRVLHVLEHTKPNPNKAIHSVFTARKNEVLGVIDEAWSLKGGMAGVLQANGNRVFDIPMGKVVGTNGETFIRIVVKDGTSEIITAFPKL